MKTTFINCPKEDRKELRQRARKAFEQRQSDFMHFMTYGMEDFKDYGLSECYTEPRKDIGRREGWFTYTINVKEEIDFYISPGAKEAYKIVYAFYDNEDVAVFFIITNEDWAQWLFDHFNEIGTIQTEMDKALAQL